MDADEYSKLESSVCATLTVAALQIMDPNSRTVSTPSGEAVHIYREIIRLVRQTGGVVTPPAQP